MSGEVYLTRMSATALGGSDLSGDVFAEQGERPRGKLDLACDCGGKMVGINDPPNLACNLCGKQVTVSFGREVVFVSHPQVER